jgi:hypothetical protein
VLAVLDQPPEFCLFGAARRPETLLAQHALFAPAPHEPNLASPYGRTGVRGCRPDLRLHAVIVCSGVQIFLDALQGLRARRANSSPDDDLHRNDAAACARCQRRHLI